MRIANNVMAMNTHRFYSSNNATVSKSAEKLSSGYRVNRAGDDAAGLAISEKMRAQVRGMNMASKNSQDAVSLVQTAEGALQEVHSMLQRMNEMAVQSANGTNQNLDRQALNLEFTNLRAEIDQVATTTNFNERTLLNGNREVNRTTTIDTIAYTHGSADNDLTPSALALTGSNGANLASILSGTDLGETATGRAISFRANGNDHMDMLVGTEVVATSGTLSVPATSGSNTVTFSNDGVSIATISIARGTTGTPTVAQLQGVLASASATFNTTADGGLTLQVGATASETLTMSIKAMNATGLGINATTIETEANARTAIDATKNAINRVSTQRATLGALQNRLEHKIANLDNTSENLSAAESRIRDVDMAKEMTAFTKNNILSQAATAMLAQANSSPQNVLSLLR